MVRHIIPILCLIFCGCEQTRSFLQMDSNSPSPFMGFQISVDASDAQSSGKTGSDTSSALAYNSRADSDRTLKNRRHRTVSVSADRDSQFVATAKTQPQTGSLKYSLPPVDLDNNPAEAAEVEAIMSRISG